MDFKNERSRIYLENEEGKCVAEVTFPEVSENKVNINHTFVDSSLRGQGVADKLLTAVATDLKSKNIKAVATCSYAVEWFKKHTEFEDIIEK
ncbi:MAG: GNAT family N-acetyltransferase [Sedimentibacter sp.]